MLWLHELCSQSPTICQIRQFLDSDDFPTINLLTRRIIGAWWKRLWDSCNIRYSNTIRNLRTIWYSSTIWLESHYSIWVENSLFAVPYYHITSYSYFKRTNLLLLFLCCKVLSRFRITPRFFLTLHTLISLLKSG